MRERGRERKRERDSERVCERERDVLVLKRLTDRKRPGYDHFFWTLQ